MKRADRMFEKLGFTKGEEDKFGVTYSKKYKDVHYQQVIEIYHTNKIDGANCVVFSIDPELHDTEGVGNTNIGMSLAVMKACLRKIKEKRWL